MNARADQPVYDSHGMRVGAGYDLETVRTLASLLDDLEAVRVATGNRIGDLERRYGNALPHLHVIADGLAAVEHQAELELRRVWRKHPLAPWAKAIPGCGEKLIARLIAVVGDPADRPNPAKLLAYCGFGDPARIEIPRRATQAELLKRGNPHAKKAAWKLAYQFMRTPQSPYRGVYLDARAKYADAAHESACRRCGPAGHPAAAGSPLSDGHKHARALRAVAKRFLLDLWVASRQSAIGAQESSADGGPDAAPARARPEATPIPSTPARAKDASEPNPPPPARAGGAG